MPKKKQPSGPAWQVILEDMQSLNALTIEAVETSRRALEEQIAGVDQKVGGLERRADRHEASLDRLGELVREGHSGLHVHVAEINNSLQLASEKKLSSISFPAISSGIFGFPKDRCAKILVGEALNFLKTHPGSSLKEVEFCIYDDETLAHFRREFENLGYGYFFLPYAALIL